MLEAYENRVGMVEEGETHNSMKLSLYISFLQAMDVINFFSKERNGYVEYLTDINGNDLVRLLVSFQYA